MFLSVCDKYVFKYTIVPVYALSNVYKSPVYSLGHLCTRFLLLVLDVQFYLIISYGLPITWAWWFFGYFWNIHY